MREGQIRRPYRLPLKQAFNKPSWWRCPCCNGILREEISSEAPTVLPFLVDVNESGTYAERPSGSVPFVFQEYSFRYCTNPDCKHTWGHCPTGRWRTAILTEVEQARLGINVNVLRGHYEPQMLRQTMRQFTDQPSVTGIERQRVVLFTGAGCSIGLGYPSMAQFFRSLPAEMLALINSWFAAVPTLKREALQRDVEILLDELFRLQNLAFSIDDPPEFLRQVREGREIYPSEYYLLENLVGDDRGFYPPLYPLFVHPSAIPNFTKPHTESVRAMLADVTQLIMETYAAPAPHVVDNSKHLLSPLVNGLRSFNPGRSLAIFTTNYDLAIEQWANMNSSQIEFHDGMISDVWNPSEGFVLSADSVCLFYLHGCCRWAIQIPPTPPVASLEEADALLVGIGGNRGVSQVVRIRGYNFGIYEDPDSLYYPAMLFPSTVKRRYAHSPPFSLAYHQLLHALEKARVLVIVGYSGRDETFKEILHSAFQSRRDLRLVVLDPSGLPVHFDGVVQPELVSLVDDPRGLCEDSVKRLVDLCRRHIL